MSQELRMTRIGCLAVHLMPHYHGKKLEDAVKRICKNGPRGKYEISAVFAANQEDLPDPKIKE